MSCLVWLPLNGDLTNNGVLNNTITNTNATVDNTGKIGKSYSFNGYNSSLTMTNVSIPKEQWSASAWVYPTVSSASGHQYIVSLNTSSADDFEFVLCHYQNKFAVRLANATYQGTSTITLDTWYHVCITFDNTKLNIYINGVLEKTYTSFVSPIVATTLNIGKRAGNAGYFKGKLNDVRIYNYCLSPKEVAEIAKGLVLHYPLTGGGRGGDNLLPHTSIDEYGLGYINVYGSGTVTVDTTEKFGGKSTILVQPSSSSTSSGGANSYNNSVTLESGKTYCYSCWIKSTVADTFDYSSLGHYQVVAGSNVHADTNRNYIMNTIPANTWTKVALTFTPTAAAQFRSFFIYFANTSQKIWIADVKLELGNYPTPWMPNLLDSSYTLMGYNSTTEYDVSGYGYNGTKTNIEYSSDTARYSSSSVFNGSSSRIYCGTINLGNMWSYGLWYKSASISSSWQGIVLLNSTAGDTDLQLGFYTCHSENRLQSSANGKYNAQISLPHDTNWHHFFATYDGASLKTYLDGVLVNTTSITNALIARSNLAIGARCRSTTGTSFDVWFNGNLSDFRLYSTVFTDAQVKELYNTPISLTNNGTLMTQGSFVES